MVEPASSIGEFSTGLDSSTKSFANLPFQQAATLLSVSPQFCEMKSVNKEDQRELE